MQIYRKKNSVYKKRGREIQELWDLMGNIVNNNLIKTKGVN